MTLEIVIAEWIATAANSAVPFLSRRKLAYA